MRQVKVEVSKCGLLVRGEGIEQQQLEDAFEG